MIAVRVYLIMPALMLLAGVAMAADFERGLAAYERGNFQTALQEMIQLGEAGDPDAQYILGRMFARGDGVLQDFVEAHKWYNLAASRGQRLAAVARDVVADRMSPEQLATAQSLARDWRALGRLPRAPEAPAVAAEPRAPEEPIVSDQPEEPNETLIARIQLNLKRLGYEIRMIDGQLGAQTQAAIRDFQASRELSVDGRASRGLLQRLEAIRDPDPPIRIAPTQEQNDTPGQEGWRRLM